MFQFRSTHEKSDSQERPTFIDRFQSQRWRIPGTLTAFDTTAQPDDPSPAENWDAYMAQLQTEYDEIVAGVIPGKTA